MKQWGKQYFCLLTVVMVKSAEATMRMVWLKRISKYCKYFYLSVVVVFRLIFT